ncbi:MAG: hypothetical protein ABUL46_01240, partial [Chitinophaga rupis]
MSSNSISQPASKIPELHLPGSLLKQEPSGKSFFVYLYNENKIYSLPIIVMVIVQFTLFKLLYPYPDFFSD